MQPNRANLRSGIRDNLTRGTVADFLRDKIRAGSSLSIVSAYFTIYAYAVLKDELESIEQLRFLFGEPRFVSAVSPRDGESRSYNITDGELHLSNQLQKNGSLANAPTGSATAFRSAPSSSPTCSTAKCTTLSTTACATPSSKAATPRK